MLPVLLSILSFAFGAGASLCDLSVKGVDIDRRSIEGTWWVQIQHGIPPVTSNRCYSINLSVNPDNRLNLLQSWKVGNTSYTSSTPEIAFPIDILTNIKGTVNFQLTDGIEAVWFVQVDYNEYYVMYGCRNGIEAALLIVTKSQERNETLINELTESVANSVTIPKGVHWVDNTNYVDQYINISVLNAPDHIVDCSFYSLGNHMNYDDCECAARRERLENRTAAYLIFKEGCHVLKLFSAEILNRQNYWITAECRSLMQFT